MTLKNYHPKLFQILFAIVFSLFVSEAMAKENHLVNDKKSPPSEINEAGFSKLKIHPRIVASKEDFDRIKQLYANKSNVYIVEWVDEKLAKAKKLLSETFDDPKSDLYIGYFLFDGVRSNAGGRMLNAVKNLSFAWQMTGDPAYGQKVWFLLKRAGIPEKGTATSELTFPDWYPKFFLDLSAMAYAYAIGYDWCYDFFSKEQRKYIEQTLFEYGLDPAFKIMSKSSETFEMRGNHNRNVVKNGGIMIAALAIADKYPDLTSQIVQAGLDNIQYMMPEFGPDGAWFESVSYWNYTISYFVPLVSTLEASLGDDFGLMDYLGLRHTGEFALQATGPLGPNNFHDGGDSKVYASNPAIFWLGRYFADSKMTAAKLDFMIQNKLDADIYDVLWYDSTVTIPEIKLEKDCYFGGLEFVSMRKDWDNPETTWLSFHGGWGEGSHAHIDGGAFIFDALGVRWACDVHKEDYNVGGYRSFTDSKLTYYRVRTEGHNTLVFNPDETVGQELDSFMKVIKFVPREENPFSVLDMTSAYKKYANRVVRGYMLTDNRNSLVIRDEMELKSNQSDEIYWFMHTQCEAHVNGKNSVLLEKDGKSMQLEFLTDAEKAEISVVPAEPLPSSPKPYGGKQSDNSEYRKIQIRLKASGQVNITVKIKPLDGKYQSVVNIPTSNW